MKPTELAAYLIDMAELRGRVEVMDELEAGRFYTALGILSAAVDDFVKAGKDALIERLMTGNPVHVQTADGTFPLRAVPEKTTRCLDAKETARTILETQGADALAQMLTTQPFKPASCRAVLGEAWKEHFTVEERVKLTQSGRPATKRVLSLGREGVDDE